jgi:hypothetical protein
MNTRSETAVATNGALVELATIEVDGKEFEANGSIIDEANGFVMGYPVDGKLTTWGGATIVTLNVTGHARGFNGTRLTCWAMQLNGRRYHGRNAGEHMLLRMRGGSR